MQITTKIQLDEILLLLQTWHTLVILVNVLHTLRNKTKQFKCLYIAGSQQGHYIDCLGGTLELAMESADCAVYINQVFSQ